MSSAVALSLFLSGLASPAVAADYATPYVGFEPDSLTMGLFVILCIWALCYSVASVWNFVALLVGRGHRVIHALLIPTIVFFGWSNVAYMAATLLRNSPNLSYVNSLPDLLLPGIFFILNLAKDWATVLLFVTILVVAWNRQTALKTATEGKSGRPNPILLGVHGVFVALIFILGTATEAYDFDTSVKLYTTDTFFGRSGRAALAKRADTIDSLFYAYSSFVILSAFDVAATSVLLWRGWRQAAISDKITNILLYIITPLYCFMCFFTMIFLIVFSPAGPFKSSSSVESIEGARLAQVLLPTLCSVSILFVLCFAGIKKAWWGDDEEKVFQQYWMPQQPQYMYPAAPGAPAPGPQAGYYVPPQGAQIAPAQGPHAGYYVPQTPGAQMGYAPYNHGQMPQPGSPFTTASSPPPMESTVGGYTPPQSEQGGSVSAQGGYDPAASAPAGEKGKMHLASS